MKTICFKATGTGSASASGALILATESNFIMDLTEIYGEYINIKLNAKNIKDEANFIASLVRRFDPDKIFTEITLGEGYKPRTCEIQREDSSKKTVTRFVDRNDGRLENIVVINDANIYVEDVDGKDICIGHASQFGFTETELPVNGKYCKDSLINALFGMYAIPIGYHSNLIKNLLKAIKAIRSNPDCPKLLLANLKSGEVKLIAERTSHERPKNKMNNVVIIDQDSLRKSGLLK